MSNIRKPGEGYDLTDDEILAAPVRLLSSTQRTRRRKLKKRLSEKRTHARRDTRKREERYKIKFCQGLTLKGKSCTSPAMDGFKHCRNHLNSAERAELRARNPKYAESERLKELGLKPTKKATAPQLMREVMEVAVDALLSRYFMALGFEFKGFNEDGNPVVLDLGAKNGIRIHGESKEGYIEMSDYPDIAAQIQIAEKLMDRVYGKPRQTTVLEGGSKPVKVQPVKSEDRAKDIASLLQHIGAIPHEGRRRSQPTEVEEDRRDAVVVPIKPEASE